MVSACGVNVADVVAVCLQDVTCVAVSVVCRGKRHIDRTRSRVRS